MKGYTKIVMYDYLTKKPKELFPNFNLKESSIFIYDNLLIVYGRFGMIFSQILGPQSISAPIYYENIKNTYFNHVIDVQFYNGKALLNTDLGTYSADIPSNEDFSNANVLKFSPHYYFTYYNDNKIKNLSDGDTIFVHQKDMRIRFDVVNPFGNGKLKFEVTSPSGSILELNSNELSLPSLKPDNYHKYTVVAYDNVWRSDALIITVYIIPYWWQTKNMILVIWITSSLFVVLLFTTAILVTRRLVLNSTAKKNLRMELELKSIYAQINPHFIFNSLNSALLLVSNNKMEEAYTHILKFSRLLRSYIKSSRNRLIELADEINNLTNYIELQQIRFKNKFSYEINVGESVKAQQIMIPSLLLQPFVENAINHGLLPKQEAGILKIDFMLSHDTNKLYCIIDDNGVGRKQSKLTNDLNPTKDQSYGDMLIKDLVSIFNKYEGMDISIQYSDKEYPLTGTTVTIELKYKKNVS